MELADRQKRMIRRRRFGVSAGSLAAADIAALVTALGGNSAVSAIYDIRLGITATAGKITQWDDARGASGFGPSLLPFSTSPGPAYDSLALTATFSNAGGTLTNAAAVALFDPTLSSIAYIGTTSGSGFICGVGTATQNLNLGAGGSTADFWGGVNGLVRSADSAVTNSTRRLVLAKIATNTLNVEAPTHAAVAASAGAPTSVNGNATLGGATGSTGGSAGVCRAFVVLAGAYSTGQRDTLTAWAVASHSAVLA